MMYFCLRLPLFITVLLFLFLGSCSEYNVVSTFPEASGICYMNISDSFYVVGDEGDIQQIGSDGKHMSSVSLGSSYDLESVVCDSSGDFLLSINEKNGKIIKLDIHNNYNIIEEFSIMGYTLDDKGIEGFTQISQDRYVISTQVLHNNLHILELKNNRFSIIKTLDFPYIDLSGLDYYQGSLYIISDTNNRIYSYDISSMSIKKEIILSKGSWEGISISSEGKVYLVDDKGLIIQYAMTL